MKYLFKRLSKKYKTPRQVQRLINTFEYNKNDTQKSALTSYQTKCVHCLEAALFAAAILEHHGYPPIVMSLESQDNLDHVIFIFKAKNNKWGAVSQSRDNGLRGRAPAYRSLRDLAWSYFDPYIDKTGKITAYQKANLDDIGLDWRLCKNNVWRVEDYLIELKHIKLKSSLKRYKKFHKRHKKNGDLPQQKNWW